MQFRVDKEKKEKIQMIINNSKKSVRVIRILEKIFLVGGIGSGILYAIVHIAMPGWSMVTVNGILQKDYFEIAMYATIFISVGVCCWLFALALRGNLASAIMFQRLEERLSIEENALIYVYRIEYHTIPMDRITLKIPLRNIQKITYEKKSYKLLFDGLEFKDYVANIEEVNDLTVDKINKDGKIIIYDHFSPSLEKTLREQNIYFEEI